MQRLVNRRIVLTGVSRGVGFETARVFLQEGASILGIAKDPERLAAAGKELEKIAPGRFHSLSVTLGDDGFEDRIVEAVRSQWDGVDVLLNNAGIQRGDGETGISGETPGFLEETMEVNLMVPFRLTRALLPLLEKGHEPRVINVSSGAGTLAAMAEPGIASYRLSKWALNGLTMLQAAELAGRISVNAFDPGWVKTDLGGERAPGHPSDSAQAALKMVLLDWKETGKFYKDGEAISY